MNTTNRTDIDSEVQSIRRQISELQYRVKVIYQKHCHQKTESIDDEVDGMLERKFLTYLMRQENCQIHHWKALKRMRINADRFSTLIERLINSGKIIVSSYQTIGRRRRIYALVNP